MTKLIKRTYRVTAEQDKKVKKISKLLSKAKDKSESAVIRSLIDNATV